MKSEICAGAWASYSLVELVRITYFITQFWSKAQITHCVCAMFSIDRLRHMSLAIVTSTLRFKPVYVDLPCAPWSMHRIVFSDTMRRLPSMCVSEL